MELGMFKMQCEGRVVGTTLEGDTGWTLDLIPRTWGSHTKVLSTGMIGSDKCFCFNGELQCGHECAFPLGTEPRKRQLCCPVGWLSGRGWTLPQAGEELGGRPRLPWGRVLRAAPLESALLPAVSPARLAAVCPATAHPGCCCLAGAHCAQARLQAAPGGMQKGALPLFSGWCRGSLYSQGV